VAIREKKNEFNISSTAHISSPGSVFWMHRRGGGLYILLVCVYIYIFVFWPVASGWHVLFKNRNNVHLVITIYYYIPTFCSRLYIVPDGRGASYMYNDRQLRRWTRVFNYPCNFIDMLCKRVDRDLKFVFHRETFCTFLWFRIPVIILYIHKLNRVDMTTYFVFTRHLKHN
jgi:hypothetical protein